MTSGRLTVMSVRLAAGLFISNKKEEDSCASDCDSKDVLLALMAVISDI